MASTPVGLEPRWLDPAQLPAADRARLATALASERSAGWSPAIYVRLTATLRDPEAVPHAGIDAVRTRTTHRLLAPLALATAPLDLPIPEAALSATEGTGSHAPLPAWVDEAGEVEALRSALVQQETALPVAVRWRDPATGGIGAMHEDEAAVRSRLGLPVTARLARVEVRPTEVVVERMVLVWLEVARLQQASAA